MKLNIHTNSILDTFSQLKDALGATYSKHLKEHCLTLDGTLGYGEVRGMLLKNNISYLEFNVTFQEDIVLHIASNTSQFVNFAYCSEGNVTHQFDRNSKETSLKPFQTAIISNVTSSDNIIYFEKDTTINMALITIDVLNYRILKNSVQEQIFQTFIKDKKKDEVFIGSYNLEIAEKIEQLKTIKQNGVVRSLMVEGMVHIILALELEQYELEIKESNIKMGSLTQKELQEVKEISTFIKNYPEEATTIDDLCSKSGLTAAKLQEGFKHMHNTTVNDFIREQRIKKSEKLIKTTDLNISEIVYSIGFSSRSYFCKIFKQKYNCTPTQYKSKIKSLAV